MTDNEKKLERMNIIYKALEDGWTVKKSSLNSKTFEFSKNLSIDTQYKGLIIFSNNVSMYEDIQNQLSNIKHKNKNKNGHMRKSISSII